jgi:hypothetical protein
VYSKYLNFHHFEQGFYLALEEFTAIFLFIMHKHFYAYFYLGFQKHKHYIFSKVLKFINMKGCFLSASLGISQAKMKFLKLYENFKIFK